MELPNRVVCDFRVGSPAPTLTRLTVLSGSAERHPLRTAVAQPYLFRTMLKYPGPGPCWPPMWWLPNISMARSAAPSGKRPCDSSFIVWPARSRIGAVPMACSLLAMTRRPSTTNWPISASTRSRPSIVRSGSTSASITLTVIRPNRARLTPGIRRRWPSSRRRTPTSTRRRRPVLSSRWTTTWRTSCGWRLPRRCFSNMGPAPEPT